MISTVIGTGLVFGFFLLWALYRGAVASMWTFLVAISLVATQVLVVVPATTSLQTTASPALGLNTFQITLLLAALAVPDWGVLRYANRWLLALAAFLLLTQALRGTLEPNIASGISQIAFLALAWGLGSALASEVSSGVLRERTFVAAVFVVVAAQAVGVVLQVAGVMEADVSAVGDSSFARLSGFMSHSGQLGKLLLLMLVLVLPFLQSVDLVARRLTLACVVMVVVMIALTYSRANMFALGILLGIWFVVGSQGSLLKRLAVPIIAFLAILPAIGTLLLRQEFDEDGGSRPLLLESAFHQISMTFLWGTGPNNYLPTVSQFDPLAGGGLPVHNSALLLFAELGAVAFLLLAAPFLLLLVRSIRGLKKGAPQRPWAIVTLAAAPGFAFIIATGHGLTASGMFPLFAFVCGHSWMKLARTATSPELSGAVGYTSSSTADRRVRASSIFA